MKRLKMADCLRREFSLGSVPLLAVLAALVAHWAFSGVAHARLEMRDLDAKAKAYADGLRANRSERAADPQRLLAEARQARERQLWSRAVELFEAAIGAGASGHQPWLDLANAWRKSGPDRPESEHSAFMAYQLADQRDQRVAALRLLGEIYYWRYDTARRQVEDIQTFFGSKSESQVHVGLAQDFLASSEAAITNLTIARRIYKELGTEVGNDALATKRGNEADPEFFKPVRGRVDVTDKSAAYCVKFNLTLQPESSIYAKFLTLREDLGTSGRPSSSREQFQLTVNNASLCLIGLVHGRAYKLTVRKGLPSQSNLALLRDFESRFSVPDRGVQVRFRSAAFVMARHGDGIIPMRTVNAKDVPLDLFRIADRSVAREIATGALLTEEEFRRSDVTDDDSRRKPTVEQLWRGAISIRPFERNKEIVSNLPVGRLIAERESRLTLMAQAAGTPGAKATSRMLAVEELKGEALFESTGLEAGQANTGLYALVLRTAARAPLDLDDGRTALNNQQQQEQPPDNAIETDQPNRNDEGLGYAFKIQWFVITDIGLTYYEGPDRLYVLARSLKTGKALSGIDVQLVTNSNRMLSKALTNGQGVAEFSSRLARGTQSNKLAAILAYGTNDFSFIDFTRDTFDMSQRGVEGREALSAFDAFVYPDRGVYRPGETIKTMVLVRDAKGDAPQRQPPLNIVLRSASGRVITTKPMSVEWKLAGAMVDVPIPMTAPLGASSIEVQLGQDGERYGSAAIQIEHFRPDRARLDFDTSAWRYSASADAGGTFRGSARAQYLYGVRAPDGTFKDALAAGLSGEMEVLLRRAKTPFRNCYSNFLFGREEERFVPHLKRTVLDARTGADGNLPLEVRLERLPVTSHPLEATVTVAVFDSGGAVAKRTDTIDFPQQRNWLGVRIVPSPTLVKGGPVGFSFVALSGTNQLRSASLDYELWRERDDFVWMDVGGELNYRTDVARTLVERETIRTRSEAQQAAPGGCREPNASREVQLRPGRYYLKASDASGVATSFRFTVGFSSSDVGEPTPDKVAIRTDASDGTYNVDDTIRFSLDAPFDGEVLIAIAGNEVVQWISGTTANRSADIAFKVPHEWRGRAFYALATVFRTSPDNDPQRDLGPARALGAVHFQVMQSHRRLNVSLPAGFQMDSAGTGSHNIQASVKGFTGPAWATALIVDEGIINLTSHPAADPFAHLFSRRALGLKIMDSYGRIIRAERRDNSGGDQMARGRERATINNYISERIISWAMAPVEIQNETVAIPISPEQFRGFDGTARLVVVAWSADKVGAADMPIVVRSPIVTQVGLPRFIAPGDEARLTLSLHNAAAPDGRYAVEFSAEAPIAVRRIEGTTGSPIPLHAGQVRFEVDLKKGQRVSYSLVVDSEADNLKDMATMNFALRGTEPTNQAVSFERSWKVHMRPPTATDVQLVSFNLAPGSTRTINYDTLAGFAEATYLPNTLKVKASVAPFAQVSGDSFGLAEAQRPARHLKYQAWFGLALSSDGALQTNRAELERVVADLLALQDRDGSFMEAADDTRKGIVANAEGEPPSGDDVENAALVLDVLQRAQGLAIAVPGLAIAKTEDYLFRQLEAALSVIRDRYRQQEGVPRICEPGYIHAAMLLVRSDRLARMDIEDMDESCSKSSLSVVQKALLANTIAAFGMSERATRILATVGASQVARDPTMRLQDRAMLWAVLAQAGASSSTLEELFAGLSARDIAGQAPRLSLAAVAWLSRGRADLSSRKSSAVKVSLKPDEVVAVSNTRELSSRYVAMTDLRSTGLTVSNTGDAPSVVTLTLSGVPREATSGSNKGFEIRRSMFDRHGQPIASGATTKRNDLVYVVIEGRKVPRPAATGTGTGGATSGNQSGAGHTVMLTDLLPTGFEIARDFLSDEPDLGPDLTTSFALAKPLGRRLLVEARDDRWIAIIESQQEDNEERFRVAYAVRPSLAGRFKLPPARVEDLILPEVAGQTASGEVTVAE